MYKCPYCDQDSYAYSSRSRNIGKFQSWLAIRQHIAKCKNNNKKYYICTNYGPIPYSEFVVLNKLQIHTKYPNLSGSLSDIRKQILKLKLVDYFTYNNDITKEFVIQKIKEWHSTYGKIPENRDWYNSQGGYWPNHKDLYNLFGSWNEAIKVAGFEPNYNDGYGTRQIANDGNLYRSLNEVWFVNNILIPNNIIYEYEIPYPKPFNSLRYDFYLPILNLYIEIDGGLRPQIIQDKIRFNNNINRNLLVIKTSELRKFQAKYLFDSAQV